MLTLFLATVIVANLFILIRPGEWKRWVALWTCIYFIFIALYGAAKIMGVNIL